jgi:hypothetical protein
MRYAINIWHGTNGFISSQIFIALTNPLTLARFEPANLGFNGTHVTIRAPRQTCQFRKLISLLSVHYHSPLNSIKDQQLILGLTLNYHWICDFLAYLGKCYIVDMTWLTVSIIFTSCPIEAIITIWHKINSLINISYLMKVVTVIFTDLKIVITYGYTLMSLSRTLRSTASRPVCLGTKHPSGDYDQIFITVRQLWVCWCGALSLTRGEVCRLQLLLVLASTVILMSETCVTHDHILVSQIWDFPFHRLLRPAGLWWR